MKTAVCLSVATSVLGALAMSHGAAWGQEAVTESPPARQQNVPFFFQNQPAANWPVLTNAGTVNFTLATFGNPLGLEVAAVDAALRAQLNIDEGKGVVITSVREDSEAAKAGLKQYDIVLVVDQQLIESPEKLHEVVASRQGQVQVQLLRQGKPETLFVTLPDTPVYQFANVYAGEVLANLGGTTNQYRLGVTLAEADDTLRSQLRLATGEGLVVTEVLPDSPVAKAGIRQHDVLIELDGKRLSTVENINALIQEIKDRQVPLAFVRGGEEMACEVTPQLLMPRIYPVTDLNPPQAGLTPWITNVNPPEAGLTPWIYPPWAPQAGSTPGVYPPWAGIWVYPPGRIYGTVTSPNPATTAADQIAELKKQLAEMQQSLQALEASLGQQPAPEQASSGEQPQEQAPPQSNGEN
jgi:membrane-associated protease RseP (regulator of RpoE activity)